MCLVSLVRVEDKIILTSNRDEAPTRATKEIRQESIVNKNIYYPADEAGGSWIFASDTGEVICLLNGAFKNHKRQPPYRMSRGLVMKSYFEYNHPLLFLQNFDFTNIEPFTMIIVALEVHLEFRWDGQIKHVKKLRCEEVNVWSSCTLYDEETIQKRENRFQNMINDYDIWDESTLRQIHMSREKGNEENGFIMNRNDQVRTISLTQIEMNCHSSLINHIDLINNQKLSKSIVRKKP